jgi:hypothetical protein
MRSASSLLGDVIKTVKVVNDHRAKGQLVREIPNESYVATLPCGQRKNFLSKTRLGNCLDY